MMALCDASGEISNKKTVRKQTVAFGGICGDNLEI